MVGLNRRYAVALKEARFDDLEWLGPVEPSDEERYAYENPPHFDERFEAVVLTDASAKAGLACALLLDRELSTLDSARTEFPPADVTTASAEYIAIHMGVTMARDSGVRRLLVYSDCKSAIDQIRGDAAARQPDMLHALAAVRKAADELELVEFGWVRRTTLVHHFVYRKLCEGHFAARRTVSFPAELRELQRPGANPLERPDRRRNPMADSDWKNALPDQPGIWWYRPPDSDNAEFEPVEFVPAKEPFVIYHGSMSYRMLDDPHFADKEWRGPIATRDSDGHWRLGGFKPAAG